MKLTTILNKLITILILNSYRYSFLFNYFEYYYKANAEKYHS